ncbi:MAG: hypothetical protein AABX66_00225 [Nanoarchaeota archaeon]
MRNSLKVKSIIVFIGLILIVMLGLYFSGVFHGKISGNVVSNTNSSKTAPAIPINYTNIESQLSKNSMIKALPDDSSILLRWYNFKSGSREWENSYLLKNSGVKKATTSEVEADITISINSKYILQLTNRNFCEIIKKAKKNGDLGIETDMSAISLGWKFKSMLKYKDCFDV